ncbi:hypothetical protein WA026_007993 [Henosepilachna vigintioctopunctata]|uniref:Calponin-homology (CH) domain-containing protein n=1 Tax=Henosepilachna vigintioctopunctata TaxID=420089 RepID=A0AAW1TPV3_9CUCU
MDLNLDSSSDLGLLNKHEITSLAVSDISLRNRYHNVVDDVEILPAEMAFMDAYEGKEFCRRLTLRNIGSKMAFVRIGAPTAKIFQLKPMERICRLPAGLSLSRMIKMKYSRVFAIHGAQIPIYINNTTIQYPLIIFLNQAKIIVEPTEVNFGSIDAVSSVVSKTVVVRNEGSKTATFCIDLGRNELELIVEPTKGVLEASGSVTFKVEVMGFYEGPFKKEFWIKTTPPKRVTVVGEFITPKIIPTYPKEHADFRMITFPRLYIGQTSTRTLIIKNLSSSDVMYCVKAIEERQCILIEEAVITNDNFRSFSLYPLEGRLKSHETTVIEIKFHPIDNVHHHAVCFIQVIRINCTDVDDSVIVRADDHSETALLYAYDRRRSSTVSVATPVQHGVQDNDMLDDDEHIANLVTERKIEAAESFRVCLYGDKEKAKYIKTAFIDIWPDKIYLKPRETKEVAIRIKPKNAGYYQIKVKFELLIYDIHDFSIEREKTVVGEIHVDLSFTSTLKTSVPKTKFVNKLSPDITNEVGFMTHAIQFNSKVKKPKAAVIHESKKIFNDDDSDLIAFPNDRAKSLRPWTEQKPCKTIFAKMPRIVVSHDEYGYSSTTLLMKSENRDYYKQYLQRLHGNISLVNAKIKYPYELTRKWMFERYACERVDDEKDELKSVSSLLPLSPLMLHNVKISPKYIRLQRVAPISNVEHIFKIHNQNTFPIFVYVTSVKLGIHFPHGHYKIVKPNEEKIITLTCFAGLVGRYINLIQVVVNFCHLYTISVMVEVVPKMINLDNSVLNFEPEKSGNIKFIELQNNLNSSISYSTEISFSRFSIEPSMAIIPQKRSLFCAIKYDNLPEMPDYCELVLTSEGGGSQIMQISRKKEKPRVEIYPPYLNLFNLPLNIKETYRLRVRNTRNYTICYMIVDPSPLQGVEIFPYQGVIDSHGELELVITVVIENSEFFETTFEFIFEDSFRVVVPIQGTIVIPTVDIRPEYIVNRQLIPFAYRRNVFYVKNESVCDCVVRFDLDQYEYFRVTEDETDLDGTIHNTDLKLLPGEVKTLYLHFHPMDALTESFYIPIIINNMVGPPLMTFGESVHYILNPDSTTTTKLPCMKITSICGTPLLHFSTLKLTFKYAVSDIYEEPLTKFFTAKNGGNDIVEFCIRIDELLPQFELEYHSGQPIQTTDCSFISKLLPGESTIFLVKFIPDFPGEFVNNLPIYVRNYLNGCIFNYLRISGSYKEATITSTDTIFYLGCTPIDFRSSVILNLNTFYHEKDCKMSCSTPLPNLSITFRERTRKQSKNITRIKLIVTANKPTSIFTNIEFECTCGATCNVKLVAFSDNCFLSHYAFLFKQKEFIEKSIFPPALNFDTGRYTMTDKYLDEQERSMTKRSSTQLMKYTNFADYAEIENLSNFPFIAMKEEDDIDTEYGTMMRTTLKYVERWISSQVFYKVKFFKIPQTISLAPIVKEKDLSKPDFQIEPTILTFMVELGGTVVREASVTTKVTNFTPKNIALHFFTTYSNMLNYLKSKGALLPHVFPEFLLTFEYYEIIHEFNPQLPEIKQKFGEAKFLSYSAQCYLDVVLQSIKLFILNHIQLFDLKMTSSVDFGTDDQSSDYSISTQPYTVKNLIPNCFVYTQKEQILLYWLQYHFDNHKDVLWESLFVGDMEKLDSREIKSLGENLRDSLVFACVTAAYCPYLTHKLTNMYVPPLTSEEYHHNACVVIMAWNSLKLSFLVEPNDIVNPNDVNMFLLTLYLYEILPSFYPRESLTLKAKLTQESRAHISLTNRSRHQILYAVIFFNNESESFTSETDVFKLPTGKTGLFEIKYQAKKISSQKAILILSGELPGKKYGRSRAISLNGITDLNYCTVSLEFKCDCFKIYKKKINLFSPYNLPDTYEVFYKIIEQGTENVVQEETELLSWRKYILGKVPKALFSKECEYVITDPEKGFFFEPIICCRIMLVKIFKIFMVGKHGDWSFDVKIVPKMSKQIHEVINVSLPRGFHSQVCSCREKTTDIPLICPRTVHITIPSKNNLFFKATKEMFIACTDEKFLAFWKKYLPMRTVFNVLKVLLFIDKSGMITSDYSILFEKTRTFNIYTDVDSPVTAMRQLTIDDVTSEEGTEMLIHLNMAFDQTVDSSTILTMESLSKIWRRYYKLNFYES